MRVGLVFHIKGKEKNKLCSFSVLCSLSILNMAKGADDSDDRKVVSEEEVIEKSSACGECLELELRLKEALLELSSTQLNIEILRKGQNMSTRFEYVSNRTSITKMLTSK
jgi:hypothetical protein